VVRLRRKIQCYQRDQVEQNDPDFVDRESCVMYGVKGFNRELEPARMQPKHPVMSIDEYPEPDEQHPVVDSEAPKQNFHNLTRSHGITPIAIE
jgi:hypothetical protein